LPLGLQSYGRSALGVPERALLSEKLDAGDLPAFFNGNGAQIVAVEDGSPENGVVRKIISSKTLKHLAGRVNRTALRAVVIAIGFGVSAYYFWTLYGPAAVRIGGG
jgi:hypothetical protein